MYAELIFSVQIKENPIILTTVLFDLAKSLLVDLNLHGLISISFYLMNAVCPVRLNVQ